MKPITAFSAISGPEARDFYVDVASISETTAFTTSSYTCSMCSVSFQDKTHLKTHLCSIGHQVTELMNRPRNPSPLLIPPSNKGYQILSRIGWSDPASTDDVITSTSHEQNCIASQTSNIRNDLRSGGGLGAKCQGRRHPVATILKRDRYGLGWPQSSNIRRITHFAPHDTKAVEHFRKETTTQSSKLNSKLASQKVRVNKTKEKYIRQELSFDEDRLKYLRECYY